jgi:hypothetical protein
MLMQNDAVVVSIWPRRASSVSRIVAVLQHMYAVGSGVYSYKLKAVDYSATRKMVLLK